MDAVTGETHRDNGAFCQTGERHCAGLDIFGRAAGTIRRNGDESTILQFPERGTHDSGATFIFAFSGRRSVDANNSPWTDGVGN
ncbi:hypothetical protein GCM10010937_19590 [Gluconobacter japonicus]|uniref:Uncharacterized protein n=1 Tax=Gluconobacter japonicus TaxID=376620 RepID=A0ABQ5WIY8_GLUJA|nr:hypothetical protein GCM10010937_19590 [Gluconobacter japonicus]